MKKEQIILSFLAATALTISAPGNIYDAQASVNTYRVNVATGYLALRTEAALNTANEIGELYTGDLVEVTDYTGATGYWYVYSPKLNLYGYTDQNYLYGGNTGSTGTTTYFGETRTVHVNSGYLALRTMKAYDSSNEIGQLYTGDTVQILETSDPQYWYVYSPKYDLNGFVNKDYLSGGTAYSAKTVSVAKGYLALRSAKSYNTSNEIGQLNTGDTVQVIDSGDSTYWYVYSPKLSNYGYVNKDYLY